MPRLGLLKTERDFASFRASQSYQTSFIKIRIHKSLNQNFPRFGFIIPKKLVPKAVARNLIKRRLKAVLQKRASDLKPVDVLFFPRPQILKLTFSQLQQEIELFFDKAHLWKS